MPKSPRLSVGIVSTLVAGLISTASLSATDCVVVGGQGTVRQEPEVVLSSAAVQVFDQLRKPLPGVSVSLSVGDLKSPARQTDSRGYVAFPDVSPGKYWLDVRLKGFTSLQRNIRISTTEKRPAHLLTVMLVVGMSGCIDGRVCPLIGGNPLEIAPLCVISPIAGSR